MTPVAVALAPIRRVPPVCGHTIARAPFKNYTEVKVPGILHKDAVESFIQCCRAKKVRTWFVKVDCEGPEQALLDEFFYRLGQPLYEELNAIIIIGEWSFDNQPEECSTGKHAHEAFKKWRDVDLDNNLHVIEMKVQKPPMGVSWNKPFQRVGINAAMRFEIAIQRVGKDLGLPPARSFYQEQESKRRKK